MSFARQKTVKARLPLLFPIFVGLVCILIESCVTTSTSPSQNIDPAYQKLVNEAVRASIPKIRGCYNERENDSRKLGTLLIDTTVPGNGGTPVSAKVSEKSAFRDKELEACAVAAIMTTSFPAPTDKKEVTFSYPIYFRSINEHLETDPDEGDLDKPKDAEHSKYYRALRWAIFKSWIYPKSAVEKKQEGRVRVGFHVFRDGKIDNVAILHSSGVRELDSAIVDAVKNASMAAPIPTSIAKDDLILTCDFNYVLNFTQGDSKKSAVKTPNQTHDK